MHDGRIVIEDLEKLNRDVFQTTQNLDRALVQIEDCQSEMQAIRQRIVHEEQQLRNILSPLHQSSDSEKNEQVRNYLFCNSIYHTSALQYLLKPFQICFKTFLRVTNQLFFLPIICRGTFHDKFT